MKKNEFNFGKRVLINDGVPEKSEFDEDYAKYMIANGMPTRSAKKKRKNKMEKKRFALLLTNRLLLNVDVLEL
ncbi:hypothetical protein FRX31_035356 [Thalictrum thalictroides]|uniref:Uncharacterized protein n=1 Tax=Thalictrum thalictroides TaxID=46969 RepID=A0A7J6URA4_THATH|nr:hypothetical protein FRX31_035356 [Thalictrum thalictroides]